MVVKGEQSSWRKEAQHGVLREGPWEGLQLQGASGPQAVLWNGTGLLGMASWGTGPPLLNSAYPGALGLDGFEV